MNKNLNYRKLPQKPFKVVNMQYQNDRKMASFCQSMLHRKSFEKTHHCELIQNNSKWILIIGLNLNNECTKSVLSSINYIESFFKSSSMLSWIWAMTSSLNLLKLLHFFPLQNVTTERRPQKLTKSSLQFDIF